MIHNSPNDDLIPEDVPLKQEGQGKKIKVVYVGILQDYRLLLEIGSFFANNHNYEFHIGGFGKYEEFFKRLSSENDNIFSMGSFHMKKRLNWSGLVIL